jgi:hypothetical protein
MAHFAELDENNVVTRVLVVANAELLEGGVESESKGVAFLASLYGHGRWKQTSYNANGNPAKRFRYAGVGYTFDAGRNAFLAPKPYPSWILNEATCAWKAPVQRPASGGPYRWDEAGGAWVQAAAT